MSLNILYIEDNPKDWKRLAEAVDSHNKTSPPPSEEIDIKWAKNPNELEEKLNHKIDIILADMLFVDDKTNEEKNCLTDIIDKVKRWAEDNDAGRPVPIIAYTIVGDEALGAKKDLYDIWDKNTASPEYVTWRLSKLSIEISRMRPDALMQRLIRTEIGKDKRVSWYNHVLDMVKRYNEGLSEQDQIERAGKAIDNIAEELRVWQECQPMWEVVAKWESLGRAVSRRARGHARHALNVFWLGFYLIHNEYLSEFFVERWEELKHKRSAIKKVKIENSFEDINNIWFYTGLFHDMAQCLEKYSHIHSFQKDKLFSKFDNLDINTPKVNYFSTDYIRSHAKELLSEFENPLKSELTEIWEDSLNKEKADHGMLAALTLMEKISDEEQGGYAREAARAISIHNLIGRTKRKKIENLKWETEPFACLLLLCDQIQTWDREREERKLSIEPERAELLDLNIELKEKRAHLMISIDYISPPYLKHSYEIYKKAKDDLDFILRDKPKRALDKIKKPWPFSLFVKFHLNREKLDAKIEID